LRALNNNKQVLM